MCMKTEKEIEEKVILHNNALMTLVNRRDKYMQNCWNWAANAMQEEINKHCSTILTLMWVLGESEEHMKVIADLMTD